jgi:hypothetical protein
VVDTIARQPVSCGIRSSVVRGFMLGTVGMHGSTRLPLKADSQMGLSKSWNFNQFRLVMLKFGQPSTGVE